MRVVKLATDRVQDGRRAEVRVQWRRGLIIWVSFFRLRNGIDMKDILVYITPNRSLSENSSMRNPPRFP